jgi:hypothetical protein
MIVTAVAWPIGALLGFAWAYVAEPLLGSSDPSTRILGSALAGGAAGVGAGLIVGGAQWPLLFRRLPGSAWWVPATAVGLSLGSCVVALGAEACRFWIGEGSLWKEIVSLVIVLTTLALPGALSGWLQSVVLRRHVLGTGRWIAASTVGWGAGLVPPGVAAVVINLNPDELSALAIPAILIGGVLLGLITGRSLQGLLRRVEP